MSPSEHESDSLSSLEDRIQRAIQLVSQLRREKEAAVGRSRGGQIVPRAARLGDEVKALQTERKQVRGRIEKLLGQIDQISAS